MHKAQQWTGHISSVQVRRRFWDGGVTRIYYCSQKSLLVSYLAQIKDNLMSMKLIFGWFSQHCLAHGAKLRWGHKVRQDLKNFIIDEDSSQFFAEQNAKRG